MTPRSPSTRPGALLACALRDVVIGCANQGGEDSRNVARHAALLAGLPVRRPELLPIACAARPRKIRAAYNRNVRMSDSACAVRTGGKHDVVEQNNSGRAEAPNPAVTRSEDVETSAPFADLLRRYRLAARISQESLADRAAVSVESIGALERGTRRAPYRHTVASLASALNLSDEQRSLLEKAADRGRGRPRGEAKRQTVNGLLPRATNLQFETTSFVGRDAELNDVAKLLRNNRLVTMTGSGGIGKTRSAIELGASLVRTGERDVWFIDLSVLTEDSYVVDKLTSVLKRAIPEVDNRMDSLLQGLATQSCVLILDSCEHVITAAARVSSAIGKACPQVTILATSREPLGISGEIIYRLMPLAVPDVDASAREARAAASVALFVDRAALAAPTIIFTDQQIGAITDICRRLDGLPLAIELAAARLPMLGLSALRSRLSDRLFMNPVRRDVPARQRTIHGAIDWSFELLSESERTVLLRFAVFTGGATLEAAEHVCADDEIGPQTFSQQLLSLVNKSLVNCHLEIEPCRYTLFDSIREHALAQLDEQGLRSPMARRHAVWLATLSDSFETIDDEREWIGTYAPELNNVRAAVRWALQQEVQADIVLAGRIVGGFRALWLMLGLPGELRDLIAVILARLESDLYPEVKAVPFRALMQATDGEALRQAIRLAVVHFEKTRDYRGLSRAYFHEAIDHRRRDALALAEESLSKSQAYMEMTDLEESLDHVSLLMNVAANLSAQERHQEAREVNSRARRLAQTHGYAGAMTWILQQELALEVHVGNFESALIAGETGLALARRPPTNRRAVETFLVHLCGVRVALNDLDEAEAAGKEALRLMRQDGPDVYRAIEHMAALAAKRGHAFVAARLHGYVEEWRVRAGYVPGHTYDICADALRQLLPDRDLVVAKAVGAQLTLPDAISEALAS